MKEPQEKLLRICETERKIQAPHSSHSASVDEHRFPLAILLGALDFLDAKSVLEVGAGTGCAMAYLKSKRADLDVKGIEPAQELREIAYGNGIPASDLTSGDAIKLRFKPASMDVVCAINVLHHIRDHHGAIAEMLRVARKAVFISDSNNFGQGRAPVRFAKQLLNATRLWGFADWAKTLGKGYTITKGDGLTYSYSVFNDYDLLRSKCRTVHVMNTVPSGINPYRTASHVAVLGIK